MRVFLSIAFALFVTDPSAAGQGGGDAVALDGVRAAYEDVSHRVRAVAGEHVAYNPANACLARFDGTGLHVSPDAGSGGFALRLSALGRVDDARPADRPVRIASEGRRLEYEWGGGVTEWFFNHDRGLEHGFTLEQRPAGVGSLELVLAVDTELQYEVDASLRSVVFESNDRGVRLTYGGLVAFDATGQDLAARIERFGAGLVIRVDDSRAVYPVTIDPVVQIAYVKASNTGADDRFGSAVSIWGDRFVVGAPFEDSSDVGVGGLGGDDGNPGSGAAYVFTRVAGVWQQEAFVKAANPDVDDRFGSSVDLHEDLLVVGAPYEDSAAAGVDGDASNDTLSDSGAAYVFERVGNTWTQVAYLKASNPGSGDWFGLDVAVHGDTIVVGAAFEDSQAVGVNGNQSSNAASQAGAAYVFERVGGVWTQTAYLKASNTSFSDQFAWAVDVQNDLIVIGAREESNFAAGVGANQFGTTSNGVGAAYVFRRGTSGWQQEVYVKPSNPGTNDQFGWDVAISGSMFAVGAPSEDSTAVDVGGDQSSNAALQSGAVYVFRHDGVSWSQDAYVKASNTQAGDGFGRALALRGDRLVVGATGEASMSVGVGGLQGDNTATFAGAVYAYSRSSGAWQPQVYVKASNTEPGDQFGSAIGIHDSTVVATAPFEDSAATGIDGSQISSAAVDSGAAYVIDVDTTAYWSQYVGCSNKFVHLLPPTTPPMIGSQHTVQLFGPFVTNGIAYVYVGVRAVNASGCGASIPFGESLLRLSPFPTLLVTTPFSGGGGSFMLGIPNVPALVGIEAALQAFVVSSSSGHIGVSTGLFVVVQP